MVAVRRFPTPRVPDYETRKTRKRDFHQIPFASFRAFRSKQASRLIAWGKAAAFAILPAPHKNLCNTRPFLDRITG